MLCGCHPRYCESLSIMKRRIVVAFTLSLFVLAVFVFLVGWEEVVMATARASPAIFALAFLGTAWCLVARAFVWHEILAVVDTRRPYWLVGGVFLTAMFAKYVTPYGQVTSGVGVAAVVSRYYESAYEESLAGIVTADFLNYVPYYTFGGIGLAYVVLAGISPVELGAYLPAVSVTVVLTILLAVTLWRLRARLRRGLTAIVSGGADALGLQVATPTRMVERIDLQRRFEGFYLTLGLVSRHRRTVLLAAGFAHLAWLGLAAALFFSALALGVDLALPLVMVCVALSKVGFVVPTPGGIGGVEIALAGVLFLLTPMGGVTATAAAILYRFATYWFTILIGGCTSIALTVIDPTPP